MPRTHKFENHQMRTNNGWMCQVEDKEVARINCSPNRRVLLLLLFVVSHIQRIGCQPEKTTLHGGQARSLSAEQGG